MLKIPHCLDSRLTDGGEVVSLMHRPIKIVPGLLRLGSVSDFVYDFEGHVSSIVRIDVYAFLYLYVCMYVCIYIYICIYIMVFCETAGNRYIQLGLMLHPDHLKQ
jgi:hypothetical protein